LPPINDPYKNGAELYPLAKNEDMSLPVTGSIGRVELAFGRMVMPKTAKPWPLTTVGEKLIKICDPTATRRTAESGAFEPMTGGKMRNPTVK
jgi:hypothetical protein